jgi:hypothetical protein
VFTGLFDDLKRKIDGALKIAVAGAIASAAAMAALTCFAIVLFLWTQQNYDTLTAWMVLGALFAFVAAAGGIVVLAVRNRGARRRATEQRERPREASALSRMLQEPAVLLTGLQIARSLGVRGMLPILILAAVAGGVMTNRNGKSDPAHHQEHADHDPDEDLA